MSDEQLVPLKKLEILENRRDSEIKNTFNFYLSQRRIRIEMAFGLLVNKWRIFCRPLALNTDKCSRVIRAAMRLHNFCIDYRLSEVVPGVSAFQFEQDGGYIFDEVNPENNYLPSDNRVLQQTGDMVISKRSSILNEIEISKITRPRHNIERRNEEMQQNQAQEADESNFY